MTTYVIDTFFILTVLVGYSNAHIKRKQTKNDRGIKAQLGCKGEEFGGTHFISTLKNIEIFLKLRISDKKVCQFFLEENSSKAVLFATDYEKWLICVYDIFCTRISLPKNRTKTQRIQNYIQLPNVSRLTFAT